MALFDRASAGRSRKRDGAMLSAVALFGVANHCVRAVAEFLPVPGNAFPYRRLRQYFGVYGHTLIQLLTPDVMRGRVSAVNQIFYRRVQRAGGSGVGTDGAGFSLLAIAAGAAEHQAIQMGNILSVVVVGWERSRRC